MNLPLSPSNSNRLFHYYNLYRLIICLLLIVNTITLGGIVQDFLHPSAFSLVAYFYLTAGLIIEYLILRGHPFNQKAIFATIVVDIGILHALLYFSSGISSGLVNLLIVIVAAGNILLRGRVGFLVAAVAAIATLGIEIEATLEQTSNARGLGRAGITGAIYFAAAFIIQNISNRISQSERLAAQQQQDIIELEKLNHQIIQSMRTGIIVATQDLKIRMMNQATRDLLGDFDERQLPKPIAERVALWRGNRNLRTRPFKTRPEKPLVQANFMPLNKDSGNEVLIFLEDNRQMAQQAQQLKLASLGRLTASIAHEVRNPLGAISHATQLLDESQHLDEADRKMTDIIKRHAIRVNHIIENILQLSRRKDPQVQEVVLEKWLQQTIADFKDTLDHEANIILRVATPSAKARFDSHQLEQVMVNLMDNGLRYSKQQTGEAKLHIDLSIIATSEQAYIDVKDLGPGVASADLPNLFEPFFTTASQGTGLGLYLSKELCEANQAQLECFNYPLGACFRIVFAHPKRVI